MENGSFATFFKLLRDLVQLVVQIRAGGQHLDELAEHEGADCRVLGVVDLEEEKRYKE